MLGAGKHTCHLNDKYLKLLQVVWVLRRLVFHLKETRLKKYPAKPRRALRWECSELHLEASWLSMQYSQLVLCGSNGSHLPAQLGRYFSWSTLHLRVGQILREAQHNFNTEWGLFLFILGLYSQKQLKTWMRSELFFVDDSPIGFINNPCENWVPLIANLDSGSWKQREVFWEDCAKARSWLDCSRSYSSATLSLDQRHQKITFIVQYTYRAGRSLIWCDTQGTLAFPFVRPARKTSVCSLDSNEALWSAANSVCRVLDRKWICSLGTMLMLLS